MAQLSAALTEPDEDPELWVGVLSAEGDHFTAGLDMPKFFGPTAEKRALRGRGPVRGAARVPQADGDGGAGITFTVGIEMMLASDIAIAADNVRFCQMEPKRGIAPLAGAHFAS